MTLPGRWSRAMIQSLLQNAEGEQVKSHEELRNRRCFSFWTYWTATGPSILSTATGHGHRQRDDGHRPSNHGSRFFLSKDKKEMKKR